MHHLMMEHDMKMEVKMAEIKLGIADKPTLDAVHGDTQKIINALGIDDYPVYGMCIHEASDLNPESRVEYLGANKDFLPMSMNMSTHAMDYGSWADWGWLESNVPVMASFDGGINYYLNPMDYTKKEDGTESDVSNINYGGNAMAVIKKIYKKEYRRGHDRYVFFCEKKIDNDFLPVGFDVLGKERDYMLIPMFYGSIDGSGRMRSIAGQWSCLSASEITTDAQNTAIKACSQNALFFGGSLMSTLSDICIMLSKSTDSQASFGNGMCSAYIDNRDQKYGTQANAVVGGGQFYGSNDSHSFNKIFHSCVLGSYMLWQRDPYVVSVNGRIKVSPDYTYDLSGTKYVDTGISLPGHNYYATTQSIKGFGAVPAPDIIGSSATGYCDHTWVNPGITAVSLRLGCCNDGLACGLSCWNLSGVAALASWGVGASVLLPAPAAT